MLRPLAPRPRWCPCGSGSTRGYHFSAIAAAEVIGRAVVHDHQLEIRIVDGYQTLERLQQNISAVVAEDDGDDAWRGHGQIDRLAVTKGR